MVVEHAKMKRKQDFTVTLKRDEISNFSCQMKNIVNQTVLFDTLYIFKREPQ